MEDRCICCGEEIPEGREKRAMEMIGCVLVAIIAAGFVVIAWAAKDE